MTTEHARLAQFCRAMQTHLGPCRGSLDPEEQARWDDYEKAAGALESAAPQWEPLTAEKFATLAWDCDFWVCAPEVWNTPVLATRDGHESFMSIETFEVVDRLSVSHIMPFVAPEAP